MMPTRHLLVFGLSTLLAGPTLFADDLFAPSYRGEPLSTSAEWDFLTDQPATNIQPDGDSVPLVVGDAKSLLDIEFPIGAPHPSGAVFGDISYSTTSNGGYLGGAAGDGVLVFNVPNWLDSEPSKQLRVQVTYSGPAPTTAVFGFLGVPGSSDDVSELRVDLENVASSPQLPAGMSYFYEDWQLLPNPDWEQVALFLANGTFIDQVVIDTVSWANFDPLFIFFSNFEVGNTSEWTSTAP